ncbi:DUF4360 domain-containing protein [Thiofilum flexile]|uniref:DUF4360 domain-containing protein n=1 Tax=Thiofilum flexile TaxID=125627 RepID=UPI0003769576|nr:DUF4360 domain-containing protein [Thiofilum flexile]
MKLTTALSSALVALTLSLATTSAQAAAVTLGDPSYGGSGCPAGSASASISPDGTALSILFDSFTVEAGGANSSVGRKSCNLSIPVQVPNGFSVSLIDADYRGFVDAPRGSMARLDTEYFFAGTQGPKFTTTFTGPYSNSYTKSHRLAATSNIWSACGASVNLRVNSGMMVRAGRGAEALATVDSADFKSGVVYHLQYRACR